MLTPGDRAASHNGQERPDHGTNANRPRTTIIANREGINQPPLETGNAHIKIRATDRPFDAPPILRALGDGHSTPVATTAR